MPVVAVVGRPNVGKSTLVNRIIGRRQAVVEDVPGVTRDRVPYDAQWNGRRFTVVDTGGWEPDAKDRAAAIAAQAEIAVQTADVVVFVVDVTVGATDVDEAAVKMLRRSHKPVILVANKADNQNLELEAVVALVARASASRTRSPPCTAAAPATCSTTSWPRCPPAPPIVEDGPRGPRRVALVGRPNVGKSSLLNRVSKEERAVVDSVAGTTVDPVDSLVEMDGEVWQFVDTAGLRKRVNQASGTEYYASLRTAGAVEAAEVGGRPARRRRADQRAGPAGAVPGRRGRPGTGDRLQQVGPGRRRPPVLPRQGDRPRTEAHPVGRSGSTSPPKPAERSTSWRPRSGGRWHRGSSGSRPAHSTSG